MEQILLDSVIRASMRVNRLHRQMVEETVRDIGLHRTAHMMLMHLARTESNPSQRELAERFSITPAAVTGILKNLERDGYITRASGRDSRVNEISITPLGREIVESSRESFHSLDSAMFVGFSEDELAVYLSLIERIEKNLSAKMEGKYEKMV